MVKKIESSLDSPVGRIYHVPKSPDEAFGDLFIDVQKKQVYDDGKTFVDLIPKHNINQIKKAYMLAKKDPHFNLREFVSRNFYSLQEDEAQASFVSDSSKTVSEHIATLWSHLERTNHSDSGSLIALPNTYIVPGGRFNEQFYWDSYFIMLGLAVENKWDLIEGIIKNCVYLIYKFGFIPTANRTYLLSRSQPPFFSHMVRLLAQHKGKKVLAEYLPSLLSEYNFWMKNKTKLDAHEHSAFARVVELKSGEILNRYYDNKSTPRPESLCKDLETAENYDIKNTNNLYLNLRAGAESGWDFSSRWFSDPNDLSTIHTTDIIPVDLNCLLYQLEMTILEAYQYLKQPLLVRKFQKLVDRRAAAINKVCWDDKIGFYMDYDFRKSCNTGQLSLAGVFPLYAKIASTKQAASVANILEKEFMKSGGLVTTLVNNSQQWDAPNGWAPLQWIAVKGLRNYGYYTLANEIKSRWIAENMKVYQSKHKLIEKYNVESGNGPGCGGEYPLQDGFGWTNGVLEALLDEDKPKQS